MNIIVTIEGEGYGEKMRFVSRPHKSVIEAFCEIGSVAENYQRAVDDNNAQ